MNHQLWTCTTFKAMAPAKRWTVVRNSNHCFRCLEAGHRGVARKRGWVCKMDGCSDTHHWLLHRSGQRSTSHPDGRAAADSKRARVAAPTTSSLLAGPPESSFMTQCATEGECSTPPVPDRIALRTIPVVVSNGGRRVTVNALMDDTSTTSYVSSAVAAHLGLQGKLQKTAVSTLKVEESPRFPQHQSSSQSAVWTAASRRRWWQ